MAGASLPQPLSGQTVGARLPTGTDRFAARRSVAAPSRSSRTIGTWGFAAIAVCSFGGPLALAALNAPGLAAGASSSAGFELIAAALVFLAPLLIWLRYSRFVTSSGGLYAFVEAAAGRRMALAQATAWIVSYGLYLIYTTVQIVYDVLPTVVPAERGEQTLLALVIPIAIVAVMMSGRAATVAVLGIVALGQLALTGLLDGVVTTHLAAPVSSFGVSAPTGLAKAGAQTSLLYVCGSLPLFMGGELSRPRPTIRRVLPAVYVVTVLGVAAAVVPLATAPGLLRTSIPGFTAAALFGGSGIAQAVGIGVAASIAAVIVCEYLALSRLLHAIGRWPMRRIIGVIGAVMLVAAPLSLVDPEGFYGALIKPSLVALWLSQLIVFLAYPRFAAKLGLRRSPAWLISGVASGLVGYGLWTAIQQTTS